MSPENVPKTVTPQRLLTWKHIKAFLFIVLIVASVGHGLWEALEKPDGDDEKHGFVHGLHTLVETQLAQLQAVEPMALGGTFVRSLREYECPWVIDCTLINPPAARPARFSQSFTVGDPGNWEKLTTPDAARKPPPELFHSWGIPVPTWHTVRGAPFAAMQMARAVWDAGGYARWMFVSCTILWLALLMMVSRADGAAYLMYMLVIGAPIWISLMVGLVQWAAGLALRTVGAGLGWLVIALVHVSALGLLLEAPNVWRAPREIREAAEAFHDI
jgi:hypothetical protein